MHVSGTLRQCVHCTYPVHPRCVVATVVRNLTYAHSHLQEYPIPNRRTVSIRMFPSAFTGKTGHPAPATARMTPTISKERRLRVKPERKRPWDLRLAFLLREGCSRSSSNEKPSHVDEVGRGGGGRPPKIPHLTMGRRLRRLSLARVSLPCAAPGLPYPRSDGGTIQAHDGPWRAFANGGGEDHPRLGFVCSK